MTEATEGVSNFAIKVILAVHFESLKINTMFTLRRNLLDPGETFSFEFSVVLFKTGRRPNDSLAKRSSTLLN